MKRIKFGIILLVIIGAMMIGGCQKEDQMVLEEGEKYSLEAEKILTIDDLLDPNRSIDVYLAMEQDQLFFGGEATIVAVLHGYDNAVYTLQWQTSVDGENWVDVPGATESRMTVIVTEENYLNYWQIQVTITDVLDSAFEQE